jgi:lipid II isoglutaminyl synthase (glutamine-hydrolysing)
MTGLPLALSVPAARVAGRLSRRLGRGAGTTLPGKLLLALTPDAIARLSAGLPDGVALVSATNGKTTTSAMTAHVLRGSRALVRNAGGANLVSGVASTLLSAPAATRFALLEVDEFALPEVAAATHPRYLLLANLFRDQLDRYGELETIGERWRTLVATLDDSTLIVAGVDDPAVERISSGHRRLTFGLDDPSVGLGGLDHAADSTRCVVCDGPYVHDTVYLGHLGDYHCLRCGHRRPPLDVAAGQIEQRGLDGSRFVITHDGESQPVELALPGIYNVYNATAAVALAVASGVPLAHACRRLADFRAAFGRFERIDDGGRRCYLLLIKNPTGANEVLRTIASVRGDAPILLALNDRIADGRDVSWIWDVDFERLSDGDGAVICCGTRAADMALRLKYAGVGLARLRLEPQVERAFGLLLDLAGPAGTAYALPTYTAMLELQRVAASRGLTRPYQETLQ